MNGVAAVVVIVPLLLSVVPTANVNVWAVEIVPLFVIVVEPKVNEFDARIVIVPPFVMFPFNVKSIFVPPNSNDAPEATIRPPIEKAVALAVLFKKLRVPDCMSNVPARVQAALYVAAPDNASITNTSPTVVKFAGDPPLAAPETSTHDVVVDTAPPLLRKKYVAPLSLKIGNPNTKVKIIFDIFILFFLYSNLLLNLFLNQTTTTPQTANSNLKIINTRDQLTIYRNCNVMIHRI